MQRNRGITVRRKLRAVMQKLEQGMSAEDILEADELEVVHQMRGNRQEDTEAEVSLSRRMTTRAIKVVRQFVKAPNQ